MSSFRTERRPSASATSLSMSLWRNCTSLNVDDSHGANGFYVVRFYHDDPASDDDWQCVLVDDRPSVAACPAFAAEVARVCGDASFSGAAPRVRAGSVRASAATSTSVRLLAADCVRAARSSVSDMLLSAAVSAAVVAAPSAEDAAAAAAGAPKAGSSAET